MKQNIHYISTQNALPEFSFQEAILQGLAPDGGLFVPDNLPSLPADTFQTSDLHTLGISLLKGLIPELSPDQLKTCIQESLNFPVPLIHLADNIYLLEVFHGPTLAFKDIGARFMARVLSEILKNKKISLNILVATSGDTGSAVAHGFFGVPNINVYILYPAGRITPLQEQQMTTLGGNIFPFKVKGSFDDCQRLVKTALQDITLPQRTGRQFSTANSINIARLLPQMIYHSWGIVQLQKNFHTENPLLSIPSGNLGNLVAAVYAHARGMPAKHFIAATNINTAFGEFLTTGKYTGRPSRKSFSSAMDVGHPSNLERLRHFYQDDLSEIRRSITASSVSDTDTLDTIRSTFRQYGYLADPHTAVGIKAARKFCLKHPAKSATPVIVTATAHPAKFPEVIYSALGNDFPLMLPESLKRASALPGTSREISADYPQLQTLLEQNS